MSSAEDSGEGVVVSTPPPTVDVPPDIDTPPLDFVDALSGVTCDCAAWSVFERPWRAARGGVAMGDLLVRRLEEVVARVAAFFSCVLMVTKTWIASTCSFPPFESH